MGEVIEKSRPESNIIQPAIEHTPRCQPMKNNEGVIYDTELENTLKNLKTNTGFFQTSEDSELGCVWNGYLVNLLGGMGRQIIDNKNDISPGFQKVFVDSSYNTTKSMNDMDKVVFRALLHKTKYYNRKPTESRISGRDEYNKNNLDNDVRRILILDTKLNVEGIVKIFIPSNILDIYTRLEILLGLKLSGHTDTLRQACSLIEYLYKGGEKQNEQQYRNAHSKFDTQ